MSLDAQDNQMFADKFADIIEQQEDTNKHLQDAIKVLMQIREHFKAVDTRTSAEKFWNDVAAGRPAPVYPGVDRQQMVEDDFVKASAEEFGVTPQEAAAGEAITDSAGQLAPASAATVTFTATDGNPIRPTAGTKFNIGNNLLVVVMTQAQYNFFEKHWEQR